MHIPSLSNISKKTLVFENHKKIVHCHACFIQAPVHGRDEVVCNQTDMWRKRIYSVLSVPAFGLLYFYTGLVVLTVLALLSLRMRRAATGIMRFWALSSFFLIGKRVHISGLDRFSRNGRYIIVANHTSLFDIIAIISFFPGLSWFGHERLTKIPVFRKVLSMINYIPMRKSTVSNTRKMMDEMIEKSKINTIGIFPEGTRSLNGKVNDFYRGFVILLRNTNLDVLPVSLSGFYDLKPKNRFYIRFDAKLDIVIHEPVMREKLIEMNDRQIITNIKTIIESGVANNYTLNSPEVILK